MAPSASALISVPAFATPPTRSETSKLSKSRPRGDEGTDGSEIGAPSADDAVAGGSCLRAIHGPSLGEWSTTW